MSCRGSGRRAAPHLLILLVVTTALAMSACSSAPPGPSAASGGGTAASPSTTPLDGFRSTTVTVVAADGTTHELCVLVADTDQLREQGLMFVEDRSLAGHDGMLFVFQEDDDGSFWMKNTRLPLSIAYLREDGSVVSMTDMAPCPADAATCPTYPAGGSYRYAIEVPQGALARLGIGAGATVTVGSERCGPKGTVVS